MGMRYSNDWILIKKDLGDGFVKRHDYKDVVEWWCYAEKKSHIFKLDGKPAMLRNIDDAELSCIIVCTDNFKEEKENTYVVKGFRFDKQDLVKYLKKTNRGTSA